MPLQIYFKGSLVKVEFALAKGKKLYDKRADIAFFIRTDMHVVDKDFTLMNLNKGFL